MLGGCKQILNAKILHKSCIAELFRPMVFRFLGKKTILLELFGDFVANLKKNLNHMKFLFEVTFGTQWVLFCGLFRPVVVSGGPKLNGMGV